jgi:hypothetical protein
MALRATILVRGHLGFASVGDLVKAGTAAVVAHDRRVGTIIAF